MATAFIGVCEWVNVVDNVKCSGKCSSHTWIHLRFAQCNRDHIVNCEDSNKTQVNTIEHEEKATASKRLCFLPVKV